MFRNLGLIKPINFSVLDFVAKYGLLIFSSLTSHYIRSFQKNKYIYFITRITSLLMPLLIFLKKLTHYVVEYVARIV